MRENKKQYYRFLNINRITDNKKFWGVMKPNFSNKRFGCTNRVILRDGGKIISDNLKIDKDRQFLLETNDVFDLVLKGIKKYSAHPSILSINEKMNNNVKKFQIILTVSTLQNLKRQTLVLSLKRRPQPTLDR